MITHHPTHELLSSFVEGGLPASLSAAIAVHSELCLTCAKNIHHMTKESATDIFLHEQNVYSDKAPQTSAVTNEYDFMISSITDDESIAEEIVKDSLEIEIKGSTYQLPTALRSMSMMGWHKMGKLSRSRLNLNEGSIHSSLLHIEKDGGVPSHTHKGFELTLLLEGSFEDEMGTYEKGDFIWLDGNHTHNPITKSGCLCYTVADDALQFTQGLSKLLNPIGSFIY
jgi:putative transcriptional regulator